jgi:hypothetical protein
LAGASYGQANLVKINPGSGGGAGGGDSDSPASFTGGAGGKGGGVWVLLAPRIDLSSLTVRVNGGDGANGGEGGDIGGGGGAGSGGSILLKGYIIVLGTNKATASGGTGGTGSGDGGNGAVGRIAVYYGKSVSGSTTPSYSGYQDDILKPILGGAHLLSEFL